MRLQFVFALELNIEHALPLLVYISCLVLLFLP